MSKEFKIGIIAIVSGIILYVGFNFLKGVDFFSPTKKYYAIYENIDGLIVSNPVILNGYSVGRVSRISIIQGGQNHILVEIDIDENLVLGDSTTATLTNSDFLGSKAIILDINKIERELDDGDTVISIVDRGLLEFLDRAQPITDNIGTTIRRVNEILLGLQGSGEKINTTLDELNGTLGGVNSLIARNNVAITQSISEFKLMLEQVNEKMEKLDPILAKTEGTIDKVNALELEEAIAGVQELLRNINKTVNTFNESEGTINKLMNDQELYDNLNQTILDLNVLINHINEYPKHFTAPLGKSHKKIQKDLNKE